MKWVLTGLICWLTAAMVQARPLSQFIVNPNNHHAYLILEAAGWRDSEAEAIALGGHLATIRNQAEEDWIFQTFGGYGGQQHLLWIGLSDTAKKFHFGWSSGESTAYTDWAPEEPNNAGSGEDFVAIYYPNHDQKNQWNDWNDRVTDPIGLPMNGVVEIIPANLATGVSSTNGVQVVAIAPTLIITNASGSIKLQWPISAVGYSLETTTNLLRPFTMFGYSEETNPALGVYSVTISNLVPQMYFRLWKN